MRNPRPRRLVWIDFQAPDLVTGVQIPTRASRSGEDSQHPDRSSRCLRLGETLSGPAVRSSSWKSSTKRASGSDSRRYSTRSASTKGPSGPSPGNTGTTTSRGSTYASSAGTSYSPRGQSSTLELVGRVSGLPPTRCVCGRRKTAACSCGGPRSNVRSVVLILGTCSRTGPGRRGCGTASTPPPLSSSERRNDSRRDETRRRSGNFYRGSRLDGRGIQVGVGANGPSTSAVLPPPALPNLYGVASL